MPSLAVTTNGNGFYASWYCFKTAMLTCTSSCGSARPSPEFQDLPGHRPLSSNSSLRLSLGIAVQGDAQLVGCL